MKILHILDRYESHMYLLEMILGLIMLIVIGFISPDVTSQKVVDLSWPNCKLSSLPLYSSGIIGITGGLDFHPNKCLTDETNSVSHYGLYINSGYPGPSYRPLDQTSPHICYSQNIGCLSYNYGYNAALYAIRYADTKDVHSNLWWIDVESDNSWTDSYTINRDEILGEVKAIQAKVPFSTVGIYSYPGQWNELTNDWHIDLPAWIATGSTKITVADRACTQLRGFDGGPVWLGQYTDKLDYNQLCGHGFTDSLLH